LIGHPPVREKHAGIVVARQPHDREPLVVLFDETQHRSRGVGAVQLTEEVGEGVEIVHVFEREFGALPPTFGAHEGDGKVGHEISCTY
jgi:hypothetical protein